MGQTDFDDTLMLGLDDDDDSPKKGGQHDDGSEFPADDEEEAGADLPDEGDEW